MSEFLLQEDGSSKFIKEDASGDLLKEFGELDPSFIASVTTVHAPAVTAVGFAAPFISSVTTVNAPTLRLLNFVAPFIASVTAVHPPVFPGPGFNPISEDFTASVVEFEVWFGQDYDDFTLDPTPSPRFAAHFIASKTTVYTPAVQGNPLLPFISSVTAVHSPSLTFTGQIVVSTAGTYTWLCPAGVSTVDVLCYGGGGAGGTANAADGSSGGGGGAFAERVAVPVTPGTLYTFVVGAAGVGPPDNTHHGDGGTTSFTGDSSVVVIAAGGTGGTNETGGPGGTTGSSTGDSGLVHAGGAGGNGLGLATHGGGGGASGNAVATGATGGNATSVADGAGGAGANGGGSGGTSGVGSTPGGGGAGRGSGAPGFGGSAGRVQIRFAQIIPSFIASDTVVYTPTLSPHQEFAPFIPSVTVVYTPVITSTEVLVPFISSNTHVYQPTLKVAFTGGGVSQVTVEVLTSDGDPQANVSQVTLEIIVPWYKGLHVWERTGGN